MDYPELDLYIRSEKAKGKTENEIIQSLISAGWPKEIVEDNIQPINNRPISKPLTQIHPKSSILVKVIKFLAIFVFCLLILSGTAFAYFSYLEPISWVSQRMAQNVSKIESLEYSASLAVNAKTTYSLGSSPVLDSGDYVDLEKSQDTKEQPINFTLNLNGKFDRTDSKNPKSSTDFSFNSDAISGLAISMSAETMNVGDKLYLKINQFPFFNFFDSQSFQNKWIKIDLSELQKDYQSQLENLELPADPESSSKQFENIAKVLEKYPIFKLVSRKPVTLLDGKLVKHYQFTVNKDNLLKALDEITKQSSGKNLSEQEINLYQTNLEKINFPVSDLWIGLFDGRPYKLTMNFNLENLMNEKSITTSYLKTKGTIVFTLNLKNYNQKFAITEPTESISIDEVLGDIGLSPKSSDTSADEDKDGLNSSQERLYQTDPLKADTDKDGYPDGEEVENGYNPLGPGKLDLTNPPDLSPSNDDSQSI